MKTLVCGHTIDAARAYCIEHNLAFPQACIVNGPNGLRGYQRGTKLVLVGEFHRRKDAQDILQMASERSMNVETIQS